MDYRQTFFSYQDLTPCIADESLNDENAAMMLHQIDLRRSTTGFTSNLANRGLRLSDLSAMSSLYEEQCKGS